MPKMNINKVLTKDYGNFRLYGPRENKPNSKPIKPNFYTNMRKTKPISIPNMQNKANRTQSCPPPADSKGGTYTALRFSGGMVLFVVFELEVSFPEVRQAFLFGKGQL